MDSVGTNINVTPSADPAAGAEKTEKGGEEGIFDALVGRHLNETETEAQTSKGGDQEAADAQPEVPAEQETTSEDSAQPIPQPVEVPQAANPEVNMMEASENREIPPATEPVETAVEAEVAPDAGLMFQDTLFNETDVPKGMTLNVGKLAGQAHAKDEAAVENGLPKGEGKVIALETASDLQVEVPLSGEAGGAVVQTDRVAASSYELLDSFSTVSEQSQNIIPLMQAQAQRILKPLTKGQASAEELALASVGERAAQAMDPAAGRAAAPVEGMPQLHLVNERVMKAEELSSRFGEQVLSMVQKNEKVMKITVQPAALGQLTVMVREENQTMSVEIHSQNDAVRELLMKQEDSIRRLMQDNEVELGKFDVLLSQDEGSAGRQLHEGQDESERGRFSGTGPASKESGEPRAVPTVHKGSKTAWVA